MNSKVYSILVIFIFIGFNLEGQNKENIIPSKLSLLSQLTLEKSPDIKRQQFQVDRAKADLRTSVSMFDFNLISNLTVQRDYQHLFDLDTRFSDVDGTIKTNRYGLSGGISRTFRNSLDATVSLNYSRISDNFPVNNFNENIGPFISDNFTTLRFSLRQPLLKGRGRRIATASERFSQEIIKSTQYDLIFLSSRQLLNMALAYWQYLSGYERLEIFQENELRVRKVLEITNDLVIAEKKAKTDLLQVQADLADKERQTINARQQLFSSRQDLGRIIGLTELESTYLGNPQDSFPSIKQTAYSSELEIEELLEVARKNRADLKALLVEKDAVNINIEKAQNDLKPQLDLGSFLSYGGTDFGNGLQRIFTPLDRREGRSVQLGFSFNFLFPLNNNAAEANFIRNKVSFSDLQIIIDNQIRNIELDISIALNEVHNSVLQLKKSYQGFQFAQEVFENEQIKFQNGLTTLINLILFQERLTFAQLDYLSAKMEFATAVVNLRFQTGTLLPIKGFVTSEIDSTVFYRLP